MIAKRIFFIFSIAIIFALSSCMPPEVISEPAKPPQAAVPTNDAASPQLPPRIPGVSGASGWPAYIPAEIPPLDGTITDVMEAAGSHVRIFYSGVTKDQFEQYLRQLQDLGFSLEYIVYVREGVPDNSDERIKAGDYDAVKITRGEYQMNIEYGEEVLTYDVSTAGLSNLIPEQSEPIWPAELAGLIPQPERCPLDNFLPPSTGWFMLTCRPEDLNVLDDYRQALQAVGFQPNGSSEPGSVPSETYSMGEFQLTLQQTSAEILTIEIERVDPSLSAWPATLEGLVPAPENCPVKGVIQPGGSDTIVNCARQNDEVVANYLALLSANGFVETSRMELEAGSPVSVTLEKDNLEVRLMIATTEDLSIMVVQKP